MTDTAEPITGPPPARGSTEREAALEDRLRKLEFALATQPAPPADEDAVADRVIAKLSAIASEARPDSGSDRVLVLAGAAESHPLAVPPPEGAVLHPPDQTSDPAEKRWFLTQLWAEIKLVVRMYLDPHYRVSRTAQFALPGIVLLLVLSYFVFSVWVNITFFSPIAERFLAVLLGILGYKLIVRELARYRAVLDYLTRYGPR